MGKEPAKATDKPVKVIICTCKNDFQDNKYGKSMRVHNPNNKGYICTVCANQKS